MDFFDVIKNRFSVRSYKPDAVKKEDLSAIINAGILAPTAANRQAFKIAVIDAKNKKDQMLKIYGKEWFARAPYILGLIIYPDKAWIRADGKNYSDVDAGIIMDHMVLAAASFGLGTCWVGNFNMEAAKKFLSLNGNSEPIAFTPLGYTNDQPRDKTRKTEKELVIFF